MDIFEAKQRVAQIIEENQKQIIEVGEHIWKNPEPGYREFNTSAYLVKKLQELGLEVKTNLAVTGFRADIDTGRPGPTLAILGELDSLILPNHPECDKTTGAVHACGHNASAASLIGTAIGLLKSGVLDSMCGKIALIATPAEEGIELDYRKELMNQGKIGSIAGKSQLLREGVFDDVDISYMHHLSSGYGYNDHNGCVNKKITFHGKSCHAASPQAGHNALNASTLALNAIAMLREVYSNDPYVRIHGIITNGGDTVNIIPDTVSMEYMLRAPTVEKILSLNERFDKVVMYAAKAAECEATVETVNGYMPLYDHAGLGDVIRRSLEFLDPEAFFDDNQHFYSSCTDMGDIATVIPAVHAYAAGAKGTGHGIDYGIADSFAAYVRSSQINAVAAVELLFGDAQTGKHIAADKKNLMRIPEYIKIIDSINKTVSSTDL
ncbi:MAG: amidohydrolase [Lentisphaeria bacterium]|nr:amidohydrolase [Lentisphaeria bacterium]